MRRRLTVSQRRAMRKLPPIRARGRPWSAARRFHGWLATWLQDRRRARQQQPPAPPPTPNAPTITDVTYQYDVTQQNWADIEVFFTFVHGAFPVANIEV